MRRLLILVLACTFVVPLTARSAPMGLEGIPRFKHIALIILENKNAADTWSKVSFAHYLTGLRPRGVFAEQYYATGHASLDNYIAMVSGQPDQPLTGSDCEGVNLSTCVQGQSILAGGRNLADQLESKRVSWKGYMDSMPAPCFHADYSPTAGPDPYQGHSTKPPARDYADRHNPFLYFPDIIENDARCKAHVRPYSELAGDIARDRVPSFAFITPDTCHDGHDAPCANGEPGGLKSADRWLARNVPPLLRYLQAHDGLLMITFDENEFRDSEPRPGCCTGGPAGVVPGFGGRVGLLALSPRLKPGKIVTTAYDHMSLLRTLEDAFGISEYLNNAAAAIPMRDVLR